MKIFDFYSTVDVNISKPQEHLIIFLERDIICCMENEITQMCMNLFKLIKVLFKTAALGILLENVKIRHFLKRLFCECYCTLLNPKSFGQSAAKSPYGYCEPY